MYNVSVQYPHQDTDPNLTFTNRDRTCSLALVLLPASPLGEVVSSRCDEQHFRSRRRISLELRLHFRKHMTAGILREILK